MNIFANRATFESLLLDLPVPFRYSGGELQVEVQAINGLRCWADHFDHLTVCAPVLPEGRTMPGISFGSPAALLASTSIQLEPLPLVTSIADYVRHRAEVYRRYEQLIKTHRYLCIANIGGLGAWGNIAVAVARKQQRKYSVWFDSVIHEMYRVNLLRPLACLKSTLHGKYVKAVAYKAIQDASLGLFHGRTVFDRYASRCKQPFLVHNIHLHPEDAISDAELEKKIQSLGRRSKIRIGYIGRVEGIKAPSDWINTIKEVIQRVGPEKVEATWLGEGTILEAARKQVREAGLEHVIRFPGFLSDHKAVVRFLRELDLFLFCHITPESPRCLIESLVSGTPIIGYENEYARDLVAQRGGAVLTPIRDVQALAGRVTEVVNNRNMLESLIRQAAQSRQHYNDKVVFEHRSSLIKQHLP